MVSAKCLSPVLSVNVFFCVRTGLHHLGHIQSLQTMQGSRNENNTFKILLSGLMPRHIKMLVRALSVNGRTFQISANMEKYFKGNIWKSL